jgi:hypothetical protein
MSLRQITLTGALTAAAAAPLAPPASQLAAVRHATVRYRDIRAARRATWPRVRTRTHRSARWAATT